MISDSTAQVLRVLCPSYLSSFYPSGQTREVNRLSRELAEQPNQPVSSIFQKLKTIEQKTFYRPLEDIIACVIGAGSFSLALGSSWIDGTAAAISGLL